MPERHRSYIQGSSTVRYFAESILSPQRLAAGPEVLMPDNPPSYIPLSVLATRLNIHRSNLKRAVQRMGIEPVRVRSVQSNYQEILAVTIEEAKLIVKQRHQIVLDETEAAALLDKALAEDT